MNPKYYLKASRVLPMPSKTGYPAPGYPGSDENPFATFTGSSVVDTLADEFSPALLWDFKHTIIRNRLSTAISTADNFNSQTQFSRNLVSITPLADSLINVAATGADPYFFYVLHSCEIFSGGENPTLLMRYRTPAAASRTWRMYFSTPVNAFAYPATYLEAPLIADGDWHELRLDLSTKNALWGTSKITSVRFGIDTGSNIDIDYIAIGTFATRRAFGSKKPDDSRMNQLGPAYFADCVKFNKLAYGTYDTAAVVTISNIARADERAAGVMGVSTPSKLTTYSDRDSVSLYIDNSGWAAAATIPATGTTYTATSVSFAGNIDLSYVEIGMLIDTQHTLKYFGIINSIDYVNKSIYVDAWWLDKSSPATSGTPASGVGAICNPSTKIWGQNTNVFLDNASLANYATGYEMGVVDNRTGSTGFTWGFDCVSLGSRAGTVAYIQRGSFLSGFYSDENCITNFEAHGITSNPGVFSFYNAEVNSGARTLGDMYFGSQAYLRSTSIKGVVEGSADDTTAITFTTSKSSQTTREVARINSQGYLGIGTTTPKSPVHAVGLPVFADNASALTGGLTIGAFYHTSGVVKVVF